MITRAKHATQPRFFAHAATGTDANRAALTSRAQKRRAELELAIESLAGTEPRTRSELEWAIAELDALLTGDLDHLMNTTAADLIRWLERSEQLAAKRAHR